MNNKSWRKLLDLNFSSKFDPDSISRELPEVGTFLLAQDPANYRAVMSWLVRKSLMCGEEVGQGYVCAIYIQYNPTIVCFVVA